MCTHRDNTLAHTRTEGMSLESPSNGSSGCQQTPLSVLYWALGRGSQGEMFLQVLSIICRNGVCGVFNKIEDAHC